MPLPLLRPRLLTELRHYGQGYRPLRPWLFPPRGKAAPRAVEKAQKIYYAAKRRAGITKAGGLHGLRHAFATHLLEAGTDLSALPRLLGHDSLTTPMRYIHVTPPRVAAQGSPLDGLSSDTPAAA